MRIGVIGAGGVGGYFGGKLARLLSENRSDLEVYFFARGRHLEEIKKNGLLLSTQNEGDFIVRPTIATDNVGELPLLHLCLLCVKSYDLHSVLQALCVKITDNTHVIPLMNGVDIYERVKAVIPHAIIYPACVYVGTHIERYGKVTQNGGTATILLGRDPSGNQAVSEEITGLFDSAKIEYKKFDDVYPEIWSKYVFIAAFGMVTASEGKTLGQVIESDQSSRCVKGIMQEIADIAQRKGIMLSENIVDETYNKGKKFPPELKTSFQRDFEKGKQNESEIFGDTIIRLGKETGVDTPVCQFVNEKLNVK